MELIKSIGQFDKMIDNKIIGMPNLINSNINFRGKNNILVLDNNVELKNVVLDFNGDNSIVYIGSDLNNSFKLSISSNSMGFIGRDILIGESIKLNIFERQNIIIGDDCIIEDNVTISTSDSLPIYTFNNKQRINFSNSIFIGDHVWLMSNSFINKGVKIGSGTIIDNYCMLPPNSIIPSNLYLSGNPAKIIKKEVFFTKTFVDSLSGEDLINSQNYKSNVFIFTIKENETLSINHIDKILKELDVESKFEFIQKLFLSNKRKNRFSI